MLRRFWLALALITAVIAAPNIDVFSPSEHADQEPRTAYASGSFRVEVCFPTGVARATFTFSGISAFTINGPGCYVGNTVTSAWTSGTKSVSILVEASAGYALPLRTNMNSRLCVDPCSPNSSNIPSGSTSYTYEVTATYIASSSGTMDLAWSGGASPLAVAPSVSTAAAINDTSPLLGKPSQVLPPSAARQHRPKPRSGIAARRRRHLRVPPSLAIARPSR